jgi:4-hydroxy-3-methylbut-2-enyl diphosphate reductase
MVKEIHRIARRAERDGRRVIVIGDRKHEEVKGIAGQLKSAAVIIDPREKIRWQKFAGVKKACLIAQSTQNTDKVLEIARNLKRYVEDTHFINTVCRPTRIKQAEIKRMPSDNDVMIIIGSKKSANTKRLYQISRSLNRRSHWVQSEKDIKRAWMKNARSVGVTAGASTPEETIEGVVARLENIR